MYIRVKRSGNGIRVWIPPLALYVWYFMFLGWDSVTVFLPRAIRQKALLALQALQSFILALMVEGPQVLVRAEIQDKRSHVNIRIHTR